MCIMLCAVPCICAVLQNVASFVPFYYAAQMAAVVPQQAAYISCLSTAVVQDCNNLVQSFMGKLCYMLQLSTLVMRAAMYNAYLIH